jgi:DNA repair protein RAD5
MSDEELTDEAPPGLFFAGSDDEDELIPPVHTVHEDSSHDAEPRLPSDDPHTPAKSPASSTLFLPASDEETEETRIPSPPWPENKSTVTGDDNDVEIPEATPLPASVLPETAYKSASDEYLGEPPAKKRRIFPAPASCSQISSHFLPTYLGDILVENAWSTVSGKGYVKAGEPLLIQRDEIHSVSSSSKAHKGAKKTGGKKQVSITSMLKPQPAARATKKRVDTVVRISNQRGSGNTLLFL